ncbi:MAG: CPBP family intramembrane metalloprotease [Eubacteriales bacterium]|nr:CPBP family intramembrane metalloprotease [Eubacteriales bacterium]
MYPIGIHFLISEGIAGGLLLWIVNKGWVSQSRIAGLALEILAITNLLILVPGIYLYRKDCVRRENSSQILYGDIRKGQKVNRKWEERTLSLIEILWLLITGGGLALLGNILISILNILFLQNTTYSDMMESMTSGKSLWILIFSMGIIAPITEEVIFRWLVYRRMREYSSTFWAIVISSVLFGAYHGNLLQFLYATLLGIMFALLYEKTQSKLCPILLHIGANTTSIVINQAANKIAEQPQQADILMIGMIAMSVMGCLWFMRSK